MHTEPNWHYLEWDDVRISRFWDFAARRQAWQDDYFSRQVGKGVVNFLRHLVPLQGRTLDYGCGPGYLVEHLLAAGISCEGMDFSADTVDAVNKRFLGVPLWGGAKLCSGDTLPYPDNTFDLIICTETIEHVLPTYSGTMLNELHRVLKTETGTLFITTPNAENLEKNCVYCPECGAVLHRYQHVQTFDRTDLASLLHAHGFQTRLCDTTVFDKFQQPLVPGPLDWSPRSVMQALRVGKAKLLDFLRVPGAPIGGRLLRQLIGNGPHLFWLGTRR